jgi:predicted RNase H-like nuclease (RuvC/YqgF family)
MDIKEQILVALGLNKVEEEIKLGWQSKSEDGGTIFVSTAEELEAGVDVSVLLEDGTTILVPIGTYKTDTGVSFRVEEEGVVSEVLESETEEEDTVEEVEAAEDDGKEADVEDWAGMEKRIQNLEDAVASLKEDKEGGDDEVEEMAEETVEPSTNPKTITTKEVVEFSAEDELEILKAENEKLKMDLAKEPAEAPINTNKFSSERATPTKQEMKRMTKQEKYLYNLYK